MPSAPQSIVPQATRPLCTMYLYPSGFRKEFIHAGSVGPKYSFDVEVKDGVIGTINLFRQLDEKVDKTLSEKEKADYVYSIVKTIVDELSNIAIESAQSNKIKTVGLTGGVSYNIPITEMVEKQVKNAGLDFTVHNRIPNGDGGISIGQNAIISNRL